MSQILLVSLFIVVLWFFLDASSMSLETIKRIQALDKCYVFLTPKFECSDYFAILGIMEILVRTLVKTSGEDLGQNP